MFKPLQTAQMSNFMACKSGRPFPLLLSLLLLAFAHHPNAGAHVIRAPSVQSTQEQNAGTQGAQDVVTLELGKAVEREVSGGRKDVYELVLVEGQYASLTLEQRGIDLAVKVSGVDGKLFAEFDFESRNQGQEKVTFVAEKAGVYRLEVAPTLKGAPANRYEIRFNESRLATEQERSLHKSSTEAARLYGLEKYDEALPSAERAAQIIEQSSGTENPEFARALNLIAHLHFAKKDYVKAEPLYQRVLEIRERVSGPEHPEVAVSCYDLARFYSARNDKARAEAFNQRAVQIREKVLEANHFSTGRALYQYGKDVFFAEEYTKAAEMFLRAASILEKSLGDDHPEYSAALHSLGFTYDTTGDFDRAEQLYRRELSSREKAKGKDSLQAAYVLHYIARVYFRRGEFDEAEALYQRALEICEKFHDEGRSLVALANLALIQADRGDNERAEILFKQVLERHEKAANPRRIDMASVLLNLGAINNRQGDYASAEGYLKRGLSIVEEIRKGENLDMAHFLRGLAATNIGKGDYVTAEQMSRRALAINERINGLNHPYVAWMLNLLGRIEYLKGNYPAAESSVRRSIVITEKVQGTNNPELVSPLRNLADVYIAKGDLSQAMESLTRAAEVSERYLALALATGSERQKLNYLSSATSDLDRSVTFNIRQSPDDPKAAEMVVTTALRLKGRVLDSMTDTLSALRHRANPEDRDLLDRWKEITAQLARRVLNTSRASADTQAQVSALEEKREKLEDEISRRSAEFRLQNRNIALDSVRSLIPGDAALVEFMVYRPFNPKLSKDQKSRVEPRYVAYVIRKQGKVVWAELGATKEIDSAVDALRQALANPLSKDVKHRARALDEKLMRPVRTLLGGTSHLLISPDGQLNLIPFEALIDEQDHYLVERYAFTYLTGGRDLLRMQVARAGTNRSTVVANPSFDNAATEQLARINATMRGAAPGSRRRSVTVARNLSEVYFAPLAGTAVEAGAVRRLLGADFLTQAKATESALKEVVAPRVLHVATHGFFLQDSQTTTDGAPSGSLGTEARGKIENPLLRSGLALAGANARGGSGSNDDGILTALEASGLNLWGTKLVVLSACDTGLGEVRNGEGVYGLRRAFVLAGAESLVMSLWPVSDYPTRRLMTNYYENLVKQKMGRGAALRQVQLKMIAEHRHPFYWANFIQSGEWANLDGER